MRGRKLPIGGTIMTVSEILRVALDKNISITQAICLIQKERELNLSTKELQSLIHNAVMAI